MRKKSGQAHLTTLPCMYVPCVNLSRLARKNSASTQYRRHISLQRRVEENCSAFNRTTTMTTTFYMRQKRLPRAWLSERTSALKRQTGSTRARQGIYPFDVTTQDRAIAPKQQNQSHKLYHPPQLLRHAIPLPPLPPPPRPQCLPGR